MKPGDIVFAKQGMYKIIGRGVVESVIYMMTVAKMSIITPVK